MRYLEDMPDKIVYSFSPTKAAQRAAAALTENPVRDFSRTVGQAITRELVKRPNAAIAYLAKRIAIVDRDTLEVHAIFRVVDDGNSIHLVVG